MSDPRNRKTVYFQEEVYRALELRALEVERTVSELVNDAVRESLTAPDPRRPGDPRKGPEPTLP